ncbi:methylenetetrahydrofolate reductase [Nocardioides humi]|uniref:Methylenetetrahydrofolate reductase n=1 Tax=Nocardioides humi TaxID=449461 RepID=A0ABN1ZYE8_9ACTN|nr:methylenetetrahydrofolate reductase [Nocardioides humi]
MTLVDEPTRALIRRANIEVIPLKGADRALTVLPRTTTVTVTCSPKFGLERTFAHVASAREAGYRVVPHVAARQVRDAAELRSIVSRMAEIGIDDLYVVGGDAPEPVGAFASAGELLQELAGMSHPFERIGVACYPEGHPKIGDDTLAEALLSKQGTATYMVSQLCFDPSALRGWLSRMREAGVTLPLRVGLAAPLNSRKLVELSLRIGVGSSVKFLSKQHGLMNNLVIGRDYEPETLLAELGREASFADQGIEGVHLFSFNQIDRTADWQRRQGEPVPA